ncbi:Protein of unknown function [Oceanobacillus limi]|uniref:DUF1510 domain-containing protein n=1 Tax=Oceanobacillus limi TaxID=930131 RepID=A0A1I0FVT7_9BACI|nr:YrrS family protein [Oceanobacillus limi]SET62372.1 Protein of unknown function [Oceanobacillus limi]
MSDFDNYTRVNKFEKRRKNTKAISAMFLLGSVFIVLLIGIWVFGGNDDAEEGTSPDTSEETNPNADDMDSDQQDDSDEQEDVTAETEDGETSSDESESTTETEEETNQDTNINQAEIETQPADGTDDQNVIEAYTGNWPPIGTEQEGPHTTQYDEGTQDRIEMEEAIRVATGLSEDDMITWWLENGGEQKVIGTVTNNQQTETYRVYISWIENEGWQPTLVEVLAENDKKND